MDSLWPYLQVKQPYLDCVTTMRVRLQEPFSALGEAVKRMIDHAEDLTRDRTKHLEHRTPMPYKYGYAPGSRGCTLACLVAHGLKKLAWAARGLEPFQGAPVIEFELLQIRKVSFPFSRKVHLLPSLQGD